jgi:peptide/nickel transport system substrate-binding protein
VTFGGRLSGSPTDQYLPPNFPGLKDVHLYPLRGDVRKARVLARGHLRSGKAVVYVLDLPIGIALGQIVKQNLAKIGLTVEVQPIPPSAYFQRLTTPGEPYDLAFIPFLADYLDPYTYINTQLDGRGAGTSNFSYFNSPKYNRLMRKAARLQGQARYRAYGRLDVQLARDAAPMVVFSFGNEPTLVSKRVDRRCIVLRPALDLTAVCLK